jgi:hypothetical protein
MEDPDTAKLSRSGSATTVRSVEEVSAIRARIFKLLRSPRIDFKESIPTAYVNWRAGTTTLFLLGS